MLAGELLSLVESLTGVTGLSYAEPPTRFGGGFFTDNYAFRLADAPSPWDDELVLRLFPSVMALDDVRREVAAQRGVAAQDYPAANVVHFDAGATLDGRSFLVMDRLPGTPLLGDIRFAAVLRHVARLVRRLSTTTAEAQVALHQLDTAPIVAALEAVPIGIERWFEFLGTRIASGADGFVDGLAWLTENRPTGGPAVLCHGDLWAGNILVDDAGTVTGVLDWTVATIAEPALDIGFTTMGLSLAPIDAPRPVQRMVAAVGSLLARRYVRAYTRAASVDLTAVPYYQALRCAVELSGVAAYRLETASSATTDRPRPTWDRISNTMVDYFRRRTGVQLRLPPEPGRAR